MKKIIGYQTKNISNQELPNTMQIPLTPGLTTELVFIIFYNLCVQKAVVFGKKMKVSVTFFFRNCGN